MFCFVSEVVCFFCLYLKCPEYGNIQTSLKMEWESFETWLEQTMIGRMFYPLTTLSRSPYKIKYLSILFESAIQKVSTYLNRLIIKFKKRFKQFYSIFNLRPFKDMWEFWLDIFSIFTWAEDRHKLFLDTSYLVWLYSGENQLWDQQEFSESTFDDIYHLHLQNYLLLFTFFLLSSVEPLVLFCYIFLILSKVYFSSYFWNEIDN